MKDKKNIYLYLALVCFAGILAIFLIDGYLGIYDTIYITTQEREQVVEPDHWLRSWAKVPGDAVPTFPVFAEWDEPVYFRYEIDNRRFSGYSNNVEVSVWKSNQKIIDLLDEDMSVGPFDKVVVDWTLSTEELGKVGFRAYEGVANQCTVKIKHGEVERRIRIDFHYRSEPLPPPPPR